MSHAGIDPPKELIEDARFVARFASAHGQSTRELADALIAADAARAGGSWTVKAETELLAAQSASLRALGATSVKALRRYWSPGGRASLATAWFVAFLVMAVTLAALVPLTYLYQEVQGKLEQIRTFDKDEAEAAGAKFREAIRAVNCSSLPKFAQAKGLFFENCEADPTLLNALNEALNQELPFKQSMARLATRPYVLYLCDAYNLLPKGEAIWPQVATNQADPVYYIYSTDKLASFASLYVYTLGSWLLPMLYGVLGATVFILRGGISVTGRAGVTRQTLSLTVMRIGLGAMAGVAVGWFAGALPSEFNSLSATPFVLAFIAGFAIDILFAILERFVAAFETPPSPSG